MLFTVAENNTGCDSHLSTNNNYPIKHLLLNAISLKVVRLMFIPLFFIRD